MNKFEFYIPRHMDTFSARAIERATWDKSFDPAALVQSISDLDHKQSCILPAEWKKNLLRRLALQIAVPAEIDYDQSLYEVGLGNPMFDVWSLTYTALNVKGSDISYIHRKIKETTAKLRP
jgi:hypothetical protein